MNGVTTNQFPALAFWPTRLLHTFGMNPLNKNRENLLFLLGFLAFVVICLAGMSVWFLSSATRITVNQAVDKESTTGATVASPAAADDSSPVRRDGGAETTAVGKPVTFAFARYDRMPDGYVGTATCASCHADRHQSYLRTHHSRSLREVDLKQEDDDQTLVHRLSKRSYDVLAKEGELWHREWRHFSGAPSDRILVGELPVCYVMGSGAYGKGYLLCDGDYLLQSPVTWYAGSDNLGMAPGYDEPNHLGFNRVITAECMFCHAGLLTQRNDNPNHLAVHELAIGCERCHGPGAAHTKLYEEIQSGVLDAASKEIDPLIVNPAKLSRRQSESICGQCHLHGDIVVYAPGKQVWDFAAGEDFAETRLHFKHDKLGEFKDSFTGHFDQLWQSQCYLQSETLTCVTCHDPHQEEPIVDLAEWRRQQCNRCHEDDQQCGLPLDQRMERADNSCTQCHMPSIESNVPHTSTTSHLIAVYDSGKPRGVALATTESMRRVEVSPAIADELLTRADVAANAMWAAGQAREGNFAPLESADLDEDLNEVLRGEPADALLYSLLARTNRLKADRLAETVTPEENRTSMDETWSKVARNATKTLQLEKRPVKVREGALEALGNQLMHDGDYAAAARSFTELTQIRRSAVDWYNLGLCFGKLKRFSEAERAFREAIRLDGTYVAPYRSLSVLYRSINPTASQQFAAIAQRLMRQ